MIKTSFWKKALILMAFAGAMAMGTGQGSLAAGLSGFTTENGVTVYLDENNTRVTDSIVTVNGRKYYLDTDGVLFTSGYIIKDGTGYLADEAGVLTMAAGWFTVEDKWYYAYGNGTIARSTFITDKGRDYYLGEDGVLWTSRLIAKNGKLYYLLSSGALRTFGGWIQVEGDWYYAGTDGAILTGQIVTSAKRKYYVNQTGKMLYSTMVETGGKKYYATKSGAFYQKIGWLWLDGGWYYVQTDCSFAMNSIVGSENKKYYMGSDGRPAAEGVVELDGDKYIIQSGGLICQTSGWKKLGDYWYYTKEGGVLMCSEALLYKDKLYYFGSDCRMATDRNLFGETGYGYYANSDGVLEVIEGWIQLDGKWYWTDEEGYPAADTFLELSDGTYHFNNEGILDHNGFFFVDSEMYYANAAGRVKMTRGWLKVGEDWYFCNNRGVFYRSAMVTSMGEKYYFDASGVWQDDSIYEYYPGRIYDTSYTTINGRRYHLNADGEVDSWFGIDVSAWNGEIDWEKVAADGVDFVYIRAGGRFSSAGTIYEDSKTIEYIREATAAGLPVGVYFYTQAITVEEAIEEADFTLEKIKGLDVALPIVIDTEYKEGGRHNDLTMEERTEVVLAFLKRIDEAGYKAMYYANTAWTDTFLDPYALTDYMRWCADWDVDNGLDYAKRLYPYQIWQYGDDGSVDGITGDVDVNIWFRHQTTDEE